MAYSKAIMAAAAKVHLRKAREAQQAWHAAKDRGDAKAMGDNRAAVISRAKSLVAMGYDEVEIWDAIEAK